MMRRSTGDNRIRPRRIWRVKDLAAQAQAVLSRAGHGREIPSEPVPVGRLASMIDHTLLRADAVEADVRRLCRAALDHGFASVCVNPDRVPLAARLLAGSAVRVGTTAGFPLGASTTGTKVFEIGDAAARGAAEVDVVAPIGVLKEGNHPRVLEELRALVAAAHRAGAVIKVILETALLDDTEKAIGALLVREAGADFVKTSTGFGPGGAVPRDVRILREAVGAGVGVKASGGIRNYASAVALLAAGATRLGTSSGVAIVEEAAHVAGKGVAR
jgi:deoxyribose-phosphate aldolase